MRSTLISVLACILLLAATSFQKPEKLSIISAAFTEGGMIPIRYTCEGDNINPPLQISGMPDSTKSLALMVYESNQKTHKDYVHWLVWNLPLSGNIPENYDGTMQGLNGSKKSGYTGMCPRVEGIHHFHFRAYALDIVLNLKRNTSREAFEKAIIGHVLAIGDLNGDFAQGDVTVPTKTSTITTLPAKTAKKHAKQ